MIDVNQLRYERDRRCVSCAFNDDPENGDYGDCTNYKIDRGKRNSHYCCDVRKQCQGKLFKNREPINKLFPRLPLNIERILPPEPKEPFRHWAAAGAVVSLSLIVLIFRSWMGI